jgi:hypothetical protein
MPLEGDVLASLESRWVVEGNMGPPKAMWHHGKCPPLHQPCQIIIKLHHHQQNPSPKVKSSPKVWCMASKGKSLGKVRARYLPSRCLLLPPKETSIICQLPRCGSCHPLYGLQAPMKAQARLVPKKTSIKQGPAKTNECALQGSQFKCIIPSKITFNTRVT